MNSTQKKQTPAVATIILASMLALSGSPVAFAKDVVTCGENAVDYDNDGWGWENEASCLIVEPVEQLPEQPSGTVYCISSDADADGDGWGWENNDSCLVNVTTGTGNTGNGYLPGNGFSTATEVALNSSVSAAIAGVDTHYYRFEVTEPTAVTVLVQAINQYYSYLDLSIIEVDTNDVVSQQSVYDSGSNTVARCMEPGNYYLTVVQSYADPGNSTDYTLAIDTNKARCNTPISSFSTNGYYDLTIISSSGIVYSHNTGYDSDGNYNNRGETLTATDLSGVLLWENSIESVSEIVTDGRGNVVVSTYSGLAYINSDGQTVWSIDNLNYPYGIGVGESAVIFQSYGILSAFNVSDGQERWVFNVDNYIDNFKILDDGRVVVHTENEIIVLAQ